MKKQFPVDSCRKASKLLSESFEHKLSLKKQMALKAHLAICMTCVHCLRQMIALRAIFAKYPKAVLSLPVSSCKCLSAQARKKIKSCLCEKK